MDKKNTHPVRVGIIGAGFAGITLAKRLASYNIPHISLSIVSSSPSFTYYPRLPELFLHPKDQLFSCDVRAFCAEKKIFFLEDTVTSASLTEKSVTTVHNGSLFFDYLIIAPGSVSQDFGIPGVHEHTILLNSYQGVATIRQTISSFFKTTSNTKHSKKNLFLTLVGGGPTGVESAYNLGMYIKNIQSEFDPLFSKRVSLILLEAAPRVLSIMSESVSLKAMRALQSVGVIVRTGEQVKKVESGRITLGDEFLETDHIIWSAGFKVSPLLKEIAGATYDAKGKIIVNEYLEAVGFSNTFILGDSASTEKSGLAQSATQQGYYIASLLKKRIGGENSKPFKLSFKGVIIPLGKYSTYQGPKNSVISGRVIILLRTILDYYFYIQILGIQGFYRLFKKTSPIDTFTPIELSHSKNSPDEKNTKHVSKNTKAEKKPSKKV